MRGKSLFVAVLFPWTVVALPDRAVADVQAVLACRQLPPGQGRADCLERASAGLEQEAAGTAPPPAAAAAQASRNLHPAHGRFTAGVESITYRDGRPVFQLDNGQTWYSVDRRRLTFKRGRSYATIEKTPVGMLLHFNGSFFALQVVPKEG